MNGQLIVADTGPIISLASIKKLDVLLSFFEKVYIPTAVWSELTNHEHVPHLPEIKSFFKNRIKPIKGMNTLRLFMDLGESEAVILSKELQANWLLIDDKKARNIAESLSVNCIGTIGLLASARKKGIISDLRPLFIQLLENKRYYSISLLNSILENYDERILINKPKKA